MVCRRQIKYKDLFIFLFIFCLIFKIKTSLYALVYASLNRARRSMINNLPRSENGNKYLFEVKYINFLQIAFFRYSINDDINIEKKEKTQTLTSASVKYL